jgi:primary-amine oxidase
MTASLEKPVLSKPENEPLHPLEPLSAAEISAAVAILKKQQNLGERVRFISISLHEPPKSVVLNLEAGQPFEREVEMVLLDNTSRSTYEAIVSLTANGVTSWKLVPDVQPAIALDEFFECETAVQANPDFQAALHKRGITDMSLVAIDPWSAGYYGDEPESDKGRRLVRTLCWVRSNPTDNLYAHPIEGVLAIVDLNTMEVIRVEDHGVVTIPPENCNYTAEHVKTFRTGLKPLDIVQPEGPSFTVEGHEIRWQKWRMRVGFTPREGLVLHTVGYEDEGQVRPILYRASLAEMTVPYGDPQVQCYRKNAFDVGEYGVGMLANSLTLGCDCLGSIRYFDATLSNSKGEPVIIKNAVCLHEEDYGILWKHMDWRTDQTEVRRSRRLVVSFIATVGNYEYGFFWYFYQDGSIQYEAKLTGMMNTTAVPADVVPKYGTLIAPQLYAQNHQHVFSIRLDMSVDGMDNSVYEVDTEPAPPEENPYGNAFYAKSTLLATELEAQRLVDPFKARYWKIVNPAKANRMGYPVGYKLVHGENGLPFALPNSSVVKRAGYMTKHLWVTPYDPAERYPAGEYPNQHPGGEGLPQWTAANESVENTDIVLWYTMAHTHIPRAEDWPVMPTSYIGFMLKPVNFFDLNPSNDVPPSVAKPKCH